MKNETIKKGTKTITICGKTGKRRVTTNSHGNSLTDQSFKEQCKASNIIDKFKKTGQVSHLAKNQGAYFDSSTVPDLHGAMLQVQAAKNEFMQVPAKIRQKFHNKMENYHAFLSDPANDVEAVKLGLKSWSPEVEKKILAAKEAKDGQNNTAANANIKDTSDAKAVT